MDEKIEFEALSIDPRENVFAVALGTYIGMNVDVSRRMDLSYVARAIRQELMSIPESELELFRGVEEGTV